MLQKYIDKCLRYCNNVYMFTTLRVDFVISV